MSLAATCTCPLRGTSTVKIDDQSFSRVQDFTRDGDRQIMHLGVHLAWPSREMHITTLAVGVLWFEWIPSLFSPQTVQRAVWSGNLNRFPGVPSAPSISTVSKRT
ncbi:hypothetical protein MC885_010268, partial [Smutsia gigantea]